MFLTNQSYFGEKFESYKTKNVIPLCDTLCFKYYKKYNWVYNKLNLYKSLNYEAWPHGVECYNFPVFSKPVCNLWGMSIGAQKINNKNEFEYKAGYLWMPVFFGQHISTDYALINGNIMWKYSMLGFKDNNGSFTQWENIVCYQEHEIKWILKHLHDFTGMINIESIGNKIIEVHLRLSVQFVDLYGNDFIPSVVELYGNKKWNKKSIDTGGYSYIVRIPKVKKIEDKIIEKKFWPIKEEKVYYTVGDNIPLKDLTDNDPYTWIIAVVNGSNKHNCQKLKDKITKDIILQLNL